MNRRIICLTLDDSGDREDCNVFYSWYVLVEHPTAVFSENVFSENYKGKTFDDVLNEIKSHGYTVYDYEQQVIVAEAQH